MKVGRTSLPWRFAVSLVSAVVCCPFITKGIEPKFQEATLQIGDQTLKPTEVINPWRMTCRVGPNRFYISGSLVQCPAVTGAGFVWAARSDDGSSLSWLDATTNTAYLLGYKTTENGRFLEHDSPPRIRRLNLETGKWLSDLPTSIGTAADLKPKSVLGLLAGPDNRVAVLTGLGKRQSAKTGEDKIEAYNLCFFRDGETRPTWTKQFVATGERPYTGGYLWGIPPPLYAGSNVRRLSWLGERLLVCPEAMQPVYCLNSDTGSEIWHIERVWEFRRGFIGPSVWSHFISRFGIEEHGVTNTNLDQERKTFEAQFQCALAGGPVSVPLASERGYDTHSVFVAVVKGPAAAWSGYLSDCLVYELGDDGKPVSMGTLPQAVDGSCLSVRGSGVVWKCQHETFVKLSPSLSAPVVSMGGGGSDGLFNLTWVRRVSYQEPQAWFVSGKAGDPTTFGEAWAYCVPGGGYILGREDKRYSFPLAAVDLSTGVDKTFVLNVPFDGEFELPTSNVSTETGVNGVEFARSFNPHLLAITELEADGHELEITLASESNKWALSFQVGQALSLATAASPVRTNASASRARVPRRLRGRKELDETLEDAAKGNDTAFVNELLKAGANPKYASDAGWTALMVAATYGRAETVEILIAAGSDVNAADKNCGGQTVLMWAARSGREAKQKIRSLLKAGAKLNGTSENGWNALMSAASEGDVEAVEYLLQAGAVVSSRTQGGETVLMAAARSGKANVFSALLKMGAEINAADAEGTTALMRAAESFNSADAVKVLLSAGADPTLKDNKGRTALAIAQSSNHSGSDQVITLLKSVTKSER